MVNREKVIKGLEHCFENGCSDCPYVENCVIYEEFFSKTLIKDVLELLKEQDDGKYEYHYDHTDCIWYNPEEEN